MEGVHREVSQNDKVRLVTLCSAIMQPEPVTANVIIRTILEGEISEGLNNY